jgi:ketosteroid isomerase-like protein
MPAPDNEDLVRRMFEALSRRAYPDAAETFHRDAVWQNTADFPGPRQCVGPAAIIDFWQTLSEDFDESSRGQIEQLLARGDVVVIGVHSRGRGRASDLPIDVRWAAVVQLRDGAISRVEVHGDWSKALQAAGLDV